MFATANKRRQSPVVVSDSEMKDATLSRTEHEAQIAATMTRNNPEAVDDILSREMQQLSFVTRSEINEEVHGVRCLAPEETPELLATSMERLMEELDKLKEQGKAQAYKDACEIENSYIHTAKFRLRFLRAELFDPKKAAARMATFLDFYVEFFGAFVLERPLQMSDLNRQDLEVLRCGDTQPLPFRDRSAYSLQQMSWFWILCDA